MFGKKKIEEYVKKLNKDFDTLVEYYEEIENKKKNRKNQDLQPLEDLKSFLNDDLSDAAQLCTQLREYFGPSFKIALV